MVKIKTLLKKIVVKIHFFYNYFLQKENIDLSNEKQNIIVFGVPTYQNIGDQAIALAEIRYLTDNFPDSNIVEVFEENTIQSLYSVKRKLKRNDVICVQGGGNLGTMYPYQESIRECVVKSFPDHAIISFPVSIFFEANELARENKIKEFYRENVNFRLTVREKASYNLASTFLPSNDISLTPDIVLYLLKANLGSLIKVNKDINKVLCFFRNDKEKKIKDGYIDKIGALLNSKYKKVCFSDTFSELPIINDSQIREDVVKGKIQQIKDFDFVVTDRLHGVILSLLANRPCIVLKNDNPKIQSTIRTWLIDCPLIFYLNNEVNVSEFNNITEKISEINQQTVNSWFSDINIDDWYIQLHNLFSDGLDVK